jgi:hypothetical protein
MTPVAGKLASGAADFPDPVAHRFLLARARSLRRRDGRRKDEMWISTKTFSPAILALSLAAFLLGSLGSCTPRPAAPTPLDRLQGYWEGEGPGGSISITIEGNTLYYQAREDFWYRTTFVLPEGTDPQQLHATIQEGSPAVESPGEVVTAILKIEDGILTLAVNDGSSEAPSSFAEAMSHYVLREAQRPSQGGEKLP